MKLKYMMTGMRALITGKAAIVPKSFVRNDVVVGDLSINTSERYTIISIQGRDFYFTPNGEFDGAGSSFGQCSFKPPSLKNDKPRLYLL